MHPIRAGKGANFKSLYPNLFSKVACNKHVLLPEQIDQMLNTEDLSNSFQKNKTTTM